MRETQEQWLADAPWDFVLSSNEQLCKAQKLQPEANPQGLPGARTFWEKSFSKSLSLLEAIEVCRRCREMLPFFVYNGATFCRIAERMLEDSLKTMAPVDVQIVRNTVGHYIAGTVDKKELLAVLKHFQTSWRSVSEQGVPPLETPIQQRQIA